MPEVVWKQGAQEDLVRIFSQLDEAVAGSGERFVRKLDDTLQSLRNHPHLAPVFDPPVRRLVVGNSGYGLFYTVEPRGLIIHALIHLRQHPETIRARIRRL